ncbi:MAG: hypothetical protein EOO09_02785 [Chitinophagaceae bacterium]|nr:MAG: hypothetical protein EOO09_02785 [Chitinophagaceae bacterium]
MKNGHPSDEDIQLFVTDPLADAATSDHVASCKACQARVSEYRLLFFSLQELPPAKFMFDLEELVMDLVMEPAPAREPMPVPSHSYREIPSWLWWAPVGLAGIAGPAALFVRYRGLWAGIVSAAGPLVIPIGLTAAVTCTALLVADMLRQYRKKMELLENSGMPATS